MIEINGIMHICFEDMGIGTSVTNMSENIASKVVNEFNLDPSMCKFYERYPHEDPVFDEISYTWLGNYAKYPSWKPSKDSHIFNFKK